MPVDSAPTIEAIVTSAKKEFIENGYTNASMRKIAKGAGVTTGALYQHYTNKNELYRSLVEETYFEFLDIIEEQSHKYIDDLKNKGVKSMTETTHGLAELFIQYVYDHLEAIKLLVSSTNQTQYGDFLQKLVDMDVAMTELFLEAIKAEGNNIPNLSRKELEIIIGGQYTVYFQLIMNDISNELLLTYIKTLSGFFSGGWQQLLLSQENDK